MKKTTELMVTMPALRKLYGGNIRRMDWVKAQESEREGRLLKIGYNTGIYGWNWNAYDDGEGGAIIAGYRTTLSLAQA